MSLSAHDFAEYFHEVHGHEPFPWQQMLVERVLRQDDWPQGIDLPTAAGKTACLDVAVFTLAASAGDDGQTPLPRRVFFVVDRRIVVDAAHERAEKIAEALRRAGGRVVKEVADRLRRLGGKDEPLHVAKKRGGTITDDEWVRDPTQPTIVTGTVDQIGSRLLFRGYGPGQRTQSIHAAMVGCDSLILLDEAHCARPFMQTAGWVRRYTGGDWCREQVTRPLRLVVLSATLPEEIGPEERFPVDQEAALNHAVLRRRIEASKPAVLVDASKKLPRRKRGEHGIGEPIADAKDDKLVQHAADLAVKLACDAGRRRIAVMVNRVKTAWAIAAQLRAETQREDEPLDADVVPLTGRMRPLERDELIERWSPRLQADEKAEDPPRPVIVVTTQCLEVGADWDFDALISECAALDALRQRFGRLNRLGRFDQVRAYILHRRAPGKKREDDPIYGEALDATWDWLHEHASDGCVDFGIAALERLLSADADRVCSLVTPSADAPVLLPAHVDLLCQTSPRPEPDPDVAVFLHGPHCGVPEARLVFRCDLADGDPRDSAIDEQWQAVVSLLPPCVAEMLPVPLHRLRAWLNGADLRERGDDGDVEGQRSGEEDNGRRAARRIPFLLWRGRQECRTDATPREIRPHDIVVVRADAEAAARLGAYFTRAEGDAAGLDIAERAYLATFDQPVLRVTADVLKPWAEVESVAKLLEWAQADPEERDELLSDEWPSLLRAVGEDPDERLPEWLRDVAKRLVDGNRVQPDAHPAVAGADGRAEDGVVLIGPRHAARRVESDFPDEDDTASESATDVTLEQHTSDVVEHARLFAERALREPRWVEAIALAARLHDAGKADERFQEYLRFSGGLAAGGRGHDLLAKSGYVIRSQPARRRIRGLVALPDHFRHEMLSMQLAERWSGLPTDPLERDLILHLIASHHGYGRPFAPVCKDDEPPEVSVTLDGIDLSVTAEQRRQCPAHRLDSGVAERFWRLTRYFGWWGLAYLESLLRLADWRASESPGTQPTQSSTAACSATGARP